VAQALMPAAATLLSPRRAQARSYPGAPITKPAHIRASL